MKRETQNILLILLGGALVKIAANGDYLRYVKPAQQPWIITGGAVMVLLGAVAIVRDLVTSRRPAPDGPGGHGGGAEYGELGGPGGHGGRAAHGSEAGLGGHAAHGSELVLGGPGGHGGPAAHGSEVELGGPGEHGGHADHGGPGEHRDHATDGGRAAHGSEVELGGHGEHVDHAAHVDPGEHGDHSHSARPAWLLLVPVLAVFLVAPPALGADSVIRTEARAPSSAAVANAAAFPPLPPGNVVPLAVNDFVTRAGWDAAGTLNGRTVSLTGFVVHTGGSTLLARLVISCCAADAFPVTVRLRGGQADHLASDAWIQVTGRVVPGTATKDNSYTPDFIPASVTPVPPPKDPYEY